MKSPGAPVHPDLGSGSWGSGGGGIDFEGWGLMLYTKNFAGGPFFGIFRILVVPWVERKCGWRSGATNSYLTRDI